MGAAQNIVVKSLDAADLYQQAILGADLASRQAAQRIRAERQRQQSMVTEGSASQAEGDAELSLAQPPPAPPRESLKRGYRLSWKGGEGPRVEPEPAPPQRHLDRIF